METYQVQLETRVEDMKECYKEALGDLRRKNANNSLILATVQQHGALLGSTEKDLLHAAVKEPEPIALNEPYRVVPSLKEAKMFAEIAGAPGGVPHRALKIDQLASQ